MSGDDFGKGWWKARRKAEPSRDQSNREKAATSKMEGKTSDNQIAATATAQTSDEKNQAEKKELLSFKSEASSAQDPVKAEPLSFKSEASSTQGPEKREPLSFKSEASSAQDPDKGEPLSATNSADFSDEKKTFRAQVKQVARLMNPSKYRSDTDSDSTDSDSDAEISLDYLFDKLFQFDFKLPKQPVQDNTEYTFPQSTPSSEQHGYTTTNLSENQRASSSTADGDSSSRSQAEHATGAVGGKAKSGAAPERDNSSKEQCRFCKKFGHQMKKCSRCLRTKYCGRECQVAHYNRHKRFCWNSKKFEAVAKDLPLAFKRRFPTIDFSLRNGLKPESSAATSSRLLREVKPVLVQIVDGHPHPFRHGAKIMDAHGKIVQILFYTSNDLYPVYFDGEDNFETNRFKVPSTYIPLAECLKVGNFMLLLKPELHFFINNTTGIRINDLYDEVRFIFAV